MRVPYPPSAHVVGAKVITERGLERKQETARSFARVRIKPCVRSTAYSFFYFKFLYQVWLWEVVIFIFFFLINGRAWDRTTFELSRTNLCGSSGLVVLLIEVLKPDLAPCGPRIEGILPWKRPFKQLSHNEKS